MTWRNYDDVAGQLAQAGLVFDQKVGMLVDSASVVRCAVTGSKQKRGWYRLYSMPLPGGDSLIVGSFGINQGADHGTQKVILRKEARTLLTAEQAAALRARQAADRKASEDVERRKWQAAADRSSKWWRKCADHGDSAYLTRKGLTPGRLYGARISPSGNLVIPVQDEDAKIWGLQVIYHDPETKKRKGRDKDFTPAGLAIKGHWHAIGSPMGAPAVLLCEGFATGASLHEATGLPVVVAFTANNLLPVAQAIAKHYRGARLLFCADDDYLQTCAECSAWTRVAESNCEHCGDPHRKQNAGVSSCKTAMLAVGGAIAVPIFPGDRPVTHKGPTDFNDLHVHPDGGLSMVRKQIEASLSAAGWSDGRQARARVPDLSEGGGDSSRPAIRGLYSLDEACERWTLLYGSDGAYFDAVEHRIVKKSDVYALIPDHAARDWKLRPDRKVARYDEVGFDPTENDPRVVCNLWGGWPTQPKPGNCQPLLDLLQFLCSLETNASQAYDWTLKWMAFPLQHHGAKMKSTLVFHGMQGAGKNLFFDAWVSLFGEYGGTVDQLAVESQFNDWASRKLALIFDEVVARNELYFLKNRIKALITGDTIRINPKNLSAWTERNHCNGVWLSNELHPCAVETLDRRHFIVYTPPALSAEFYREIAGCLKQGGAAALHHHLLQLPLGDFDEHAKPPMTDAKLAVQQLSAGSIERFFAEWTAGETHYPVCPCASSQIYRAYAKWCVSSGEKPRSQNNLSGFVLKQPGWSICLKDIFDNSHYSGRPSRQRMVLPPPDLLQTKSGVDYRKKADKTEAQWTTDCFFSFDSALGNKE